MTLPTPQLVAAYVIIGGIAASIGTSLAHGSAVDWQSILALCTGFGLIHVPDTIKAIKGDK